MEEILREENLKMAIKKSSRTKKHLECTRIDIIIELLEKRNEYKKGFFYQKEKIFLLENM